MVLGGLGALMECSWEGLGRSWGGLGGSWGALGGVLGGSWAILRRSWSVMGPLGGGLGASRGALGAILGPLGVILDRLEATKNQSKIDLRKKHLKNRSWKHFFSNLGARKRGFRGICVSLLARMSAS